MPAPLVLQLTDAGLAAVQAASGSDQAVIAELGLTATPFDYAPTLDALPGEFKRIPVTSGVAAAANITHLTVYDTSGDAWDATGFGLFLDDGTLFAVYTQADTVLAKAALAFGLLAFDIAFNGDMSANIAFGDATFVYPPATEETRGVARIATQAEVDAGEDDEKIVTAVKLAERLAPILLSLADEIAARSDADYDLDVALTALEQRVIHGAGLVIGGGNLLSDRTLTVTAATAAQALARTLNTIAVTPLALADFVDMARVSNSANATCWRLTFGGTDYYLQMGNGNLTGDNSVIVPFPQEYSTRAYVIASGNSTDVSNEGNSAQSGWTLQDVTIVNNGNPNAPYTWVAFGW